jgi:hypothetical protein
MNFFCNEFFCSNLAAMLLAMVLIEYKILYRVKDSIARGKTKGFIKTKSLERMGGWCVRYGWVVCEV